MNYNQEPSLDDITFLIQKCNEELIVEPEFNMNAVDYENYQL